MEAEAFLQPHVPLEEVLEEAGSHRRRREVWFYAPSFKHYEVAGRCNDPWSFPAISITGARCALDCEHCRGVILRHMIPATTPRELYEKCLEVYEHGGRGVLISGGSTPSGSVPLKPFLPVVARVKRELGLTIAVHTGLVDEEVARLMARAKVDSALIDVIGDVDTIQQVCHLNATVDAFESSLRLLEAHGLATIPHVVVGLHYGMLKGELKALRIIAQGRPAAVVVVVLTPLPGTGMEYVEPPSPEVAARIVAAARALLPDAPLALGCARPHGEHKALLDTLALTAGVDAVAFPSEEAFKEASKLGLAVRFSSTCCSQVYVDSPT